MGVTILGKAAPPAIVSLRYAVGGSLIMKAVP